MLKVFTHPPTDDIYLGLRDDGAGNIMLVAVNSGNQDVSTLLRISSSGIFRLSKSQEERTKLSKHLRFDEYGKIRIDE